MTDLLDPIYLTTPAYFGPIEWAFFTLQIVGVVAGIYLAFMRPDSNALRRMLLQRLGFALMFVGGIGVLLGLLRLQLVPVFSQRYWFVLLLLANVGLAGYSIYYARLVYPGQLAQSHTSRGKGKASNRQSSSRQSPARVTGSQPSTNGSSESAAELEEQNAARGGRREARQRRKRKRH